MRLGTSVLGLAIPASGMAVLIRDEQNAIMARTPAHIKAGVDRAHATGPVPSSIGVLRAVTFKSLQQQGRTVADLIFKYIGTLDDGRDDGPEATQAMDYCLAAYDSHEDYEGVNNAARRALTCYDVGEDHSKRFGIWHSRVLGGP